MMRPHVTALKMRGAGRVQIPDHNIAFNMACFPLIRFIQKKKIDLCALLIQQMELAKSEPI